MILKTQTSGIKQTPLKMKWMDKKYLKALEILQRFSQNFRNSSKILLTNHFFLISKYQIINLFF